MTDSRWHSSAEVDICHLSYAIGKRGEVPKTKSPVLKAEIVALHHGLTFKKLTFYAFLASLTA
jgi:hypothetical protein